MRTRTKALLAAAGVIIIALAVDAWDVFADSFDQGSVRGNTKSFVLVAGSMA